MRYLLKYSGVARAPQWRPPHKHFRKILSVALFRNIHAALKTLVFLMTFADCTCPSLLPLSIVSSMCCPSPDGLCHTRGWVRMERRDLDCHPRERTLPGGWGRRCQRQVPGGHLLNNASGLGVGAGRRATLKCCRNICSLSF